MPVLNHHIVAARNKEETASYFAEILGFAPPVKLGEFAVLQVSGDTTLDFIDNDGRGVYFDPNGHRLEIITRHYGSGGTETKHPHPLIAPVIETANQGRWS